MNIEKKWTNYHQDVCKKLQKIIKYEQKAVNNHQNMLIIVLQVLCKRLHIQKTI